MNITKRIIALVIALFMVAALAACSGGEKSDEGTDGTNYLEGTSENQVALFGDLSGTKLRVADDVVLDKWEEDFYNQLRESTGMTIEIEGMSSSELLTKISQAVASKDTRNYFDVAVVINTNLLNCVYGNLIVPMDNYIDRNDPVWKYSYSDNTDFLAPDVFKIDGVTYGAPSHGYHETFIFYNKTYFEEMQAPDPYEEYYLKDNWTFQTFMDTCKAVTKKDAEGKVEVAAWASWNYFSFLAAAGNNVVEQNDKGKWEVVVDRPDGMAGLNLLYECAKNGWLDTSTSGYEEFVNRKIAMIVDKPSSAMGGPEAYSRMTDEIGMIPFPKMDANQEKYICPLTVSGYGIASCAQNPTGAAAWIYYHRIAEMRRDESEWGQQNIRRFLDDEAMERRLEYLNKCDFTVSMIEGLTGWYNETRTQFLGKIFKEQQNPATVIESLIPLIRGSLKKTVG